MSAIRFSIWAGAWSFVWLFGGFAQAQSSSDPSVTLSIVEPSGVRTYPVPWTPGLSVLSVMEQGLPAVSGVAAFSVNYFPEYGGYFVSTIGGVPESNEEAYWSVCLTPAGPGSTMITLPIAPNKVLVGKDDAVVLAFDQPCPNAPAPQKP